MKNKKSGAWRRAALFSTFALAVFACLLAGCEMYGYGRLGGADQTESLDPGDSLFDGVMSSLSGVWYSHYAGTGRLDGYRIGQWKDFKRLIEESGKIALFPDVEKPYKTYTQESGSDTPHDEDYFVLYDDTVYGESGEGVGGNGGWNFGYMGIVRAANIFNGDKDRGALIIEYLKGCAPQWDDDIKDGGRPFFGIYYRVLKEDIIQMANAVDLAALYTGEKYYTETEHLDEAIERNGVENEAEFISWGVVNPQNRERE
jgi:hypothetical protein